MGRRIQRNDGVRELLIAERERATERWPSSTPDAWLVALRAGDAVPVSSAQLMRALMRAGLPHRNYCYGGSAFGAVFLLNRDDRLTEFALENR